MSREAVVLILIVTGACSRSNNVLLGRVEAQVGGRSVVVTDCYRTSVPKPTTEGSGADRVYRFAPCRDAVLEIRHDSLAVNGRSYGVIAARDTIVVDHGVVRLGRAT